MAELIAPNSNDPQEIAKQVEAIAEAAAQHDEQVAQLLNLVPKAAALSTAASRAINFTKKDWVDTPTSGTPITVADMNRIEQAIVDLNTTLTSVQNSLSQTLSRLGVNPADVSLDDPSLTGFFWANQGVTPGTYPAGVSYGLVVSLAVEGACVQLMFIDGSVSFRVYVNSGWKAWTSLQVGAGVTFGAGTFTDSTGLAVVFSINGMQLQVKQNGLYYVDATGTPTAIWGMFP